MKNHRIAWLMLATLALLAGRPSSAHEKSLTDLDLATLMNMDVIVTSAARREQAEGDAAAAVFVITREDIRRSGKTSIPELLREVPGLQVARITNSRWAISARGFNSRFANKVLVLIDGRSIYTSVTSGVLWEEQSVPLEEIERIEVIRGPGGALWGTNAMNGVINIVTRSAHDTRGLAVSAGGGNQEHGAARLRYGLQLGDAADLRVWFDRFERDSFDSRASSWERLQGGWRLDSTAGDGRVTFQGDLYRSDLGNYILARDLSQAVTADGGNVNLSWQTPLVGEDQLDLRTFYSWSSQNKFASRAGAESIAAIEAQYGFPRMGRHHVTAGAGFRQCRDHLRGAPGVTDFTPEDTQHSPFSGYAQDEIYFLGDALRLIIGAKLEDLAFTGSAFQPTARALWHVNGEHTLWTAASRAVRTPSRLEYHSRIYLRPLPDIPYSAVIVGNENLRAERLNAAEAGWRWRVSEHLSTDVAVFTHSYRDLIALTIGTPEIGSGSQTPVLPLNWGNLAHADTHGTELAVDWIAADFLRLQASGTWLDVHAPAAFGLSTSDAAVDPHLTYTLRARADLPRGFELDVAWRKLDDIPAWTIESYDAVDTRLGWRPNSHFELSLAVENLFDNRHQEFWNEEGQWTGDVLGRSYFARVTWRPGH